jgi:hypothetical protein
VRPGGRGRQLSADPLGGGAVSVVDRQTLHRSLASSGSVLIGFIGLSHELVGATLFPWGPAEFGGPIGWHLLGLAAMGIGLLLLLGTLHILPTPVIALSILAAALGAVITGYTALMHNQFQFLALSFCLSAVVVAACYRSAEGRPAA